MQTWRDHHPDWEYTLYGNDFFDSQQFRTQRQMDEYVKRGQYEGVADLMRYEILLSQGGFIAEADSVCLHNTSELFVDGDVFTIYENEFLRGQLVSPILASKPGNRFVEKLIEHLEAVPPEMLEAPWKSTGNRFVAEMIEKHAPEITIFPSYKMIPVHFDGRVYKGNEKVYAKQLFGTGRKAYGDAEAGWFTRRKARRARKAQTEYRKAAEKRLSQIQQDKFDGN